MSLSQHPWESMDCRRKDQECEWCSEKSHVRRQRHIPIAPWEENKQEPGNDIESLRSLRFDIVRKALELSDDCLEGTNNAIISNKKSSIIDKSSHKNSDSFHLSALASALPINELDKKGSFLWHGEHSYLFGPFCAVLKEERRNNRKRHFRSSSEERVGEGGRERSIIIKSNAIESSSFPTVAHLSQESTSRTSTCDFVTLEGCYDQVQQEGNHNRKKNKRSLVERLPFDSMSNNNAKRQCRMSSGRGLRRASMKFVDLPSL